MNYVLERVGSDATFRMSRGIYEPTYGTPDSLEEMASEHREFYEDMHATTYDGIFVYSRRIWNIVRSRQSLASNHKSSVSIASIFCVVPQLRVFLRF